MATTGVDADLKEPGVELRSPSGQADVTAEGEVHPRADGGAVDGRDRRQRAAGDPQEPLVDVAEAAAVGLLQVAEVGAGTEGRWRPRDHDRADRFVGLEHVHRRHDLVDHRRRQRVALVGVVEGERADTVGDLGENQSHHLVLVVSHPGVVTPLCSENLVLVTSSRPARSLRGSARSSRMPGRRAPPASRAGAEARCDTGERSVDPHAPRGRRQRRRVAERPSSPDEVYRWRPTTRIAQTRTSTSRRCSTTAAACSMARGSTPRAHPLALLDDVTAMIAGSPTVALTGELAEEWASSAIFDAEGLRPTHRPTRVTRADPRPGDASITRPPDVIS